MLRVFIACKAVLRASGQRGLNPLTWTSGRHSRQGDDDDLCPRCRGWPGSLGHARCHQSGDLRTDSELVRRCHGVPAHRRRIPRRARVAELPHLALHRRLRAFAYSRRHAGDQDRHEEDARARATGPRSGRRDVWAVLYLHRACILPGRQRHRWLSIHRHGDRRGLRLVSRERCHLRPRDHRRRRLQRGRPLPSISGCTYNGRRVGTHHWSWLACSNCS